MKKGFTLVELLIVIAILAVLSAVGIANFQSARVKARDVGRKSDLQTIVKSLEAYVNDHGSYPLSNSDGEIICKSSAPVECIWGEPFTDDNGTVYAAILPSDTSGLSYYYSSQTGTSFTLYAYLENANDPAITTISPTILCGNKDCNYKINSSNIQ